MTLRSIFLFASILTTACTVKGELGESRFNVGDNWSGGDIALGSQFSAEARKHIFGEGLEVMSSDETILRPYIGGFVAAEIGEANLMAVDAAGQPVDFLSFGVKEADRLLLSDGMMQEIPHQFAMLLDSRLELHHHP